MKVVRTRPDVEEDDRPEVDDRQFVGINRAIRLLRNEIVHHPQEPGSQKEANSVVAVPPLHQRILHARKDLHGF